MKKALKRHGSPDRIITDGLKSYRAAMRDFGNGDRQDVGRHANNLHANVSNLFNLERNLVDRETFEERRFAAMAAVVP